MTSLRFVEQLRDLVGDVDVVLSDIWGVVHNGLESFPEACEALHTFRKQGGTVILITNAHRDSLSLKLERIELAPYFERLISSHDYGFPKENPQFWDALQADIGFDPTRSLFIDDTLPILRSAQAFGVGHLLAVKEPSLPLISAYSAVPLASSS